MEGKREESPVDNRTGNCSVSFLSVLSYSLPSHSCFLLASRTALTLSPWHYLPHPPSLGNDAIRLHQRCDLKQTGSPSWPLPPFHLLFLGSLSSDSFTLIAPRQGATPNPTPPHSGPHSPSGQRKELEGTCCLVAFQDASLSALLLALTTQSS